MSSPYRKSRTSFLQCKVLPRISLDPGKPHAHNAKSRPTACKSLERLSSGAARCGWILQTWLGQMLWTKRLTFMCAMVTPLRLRQHAIRRPGSGPSGTGGDQRGPSPSPSGVSHTLSLVGPGWATCFQTSSFHGQAEPADGTRGQRRLGEAPTQQIALPLRASPAHQSRLQHLDLRISTKDGEFCGGGGSRKPARGPHAPALPVMRNRFRVPHGCPWSICDHHESARQG
jgi:hypothetical protein